MNIVKVDKQYLTSDILSNQIREVIPSSLDFNRFRRVILSAAQKTPKLMECTRHSFYNALMQSSMLGLEPNTPQGLCYLIPYKNNKSRLIHCNFQLGYKGFITLTRRSKEVNTINAQAVLRGDIFEVRLGTDYFINHVPAYNCNPTTKENFLKDVSFVYAVCKFRDGSFEFEVMTLDEVEHIRSKYAAQNSEAWLNFYGEMAKKTVLKRLLKRIPLDIEDNRLADAIEIDGKNEANKPVDITDYVDMSNVEEYKQQAQEEEDLKAGRERASLKLDDIKRSEQEEPKKESKQEQKKQEQEPKKQKQEKQEQEPVNNFGSPGFDQHKEDLQEARDELKYTFNMMSKELRDKVIKGMYPGGKQTIIPFDRLTKRSIDTLRDIIKVEKDKHFNVDVGEDF